MVEKLVVTVDQAAKALGISRGLAYEMARQGRIPAIRLGRRLLVPRSALERMLAEADVGAGENDGSGLDLP